MPGRDSIVAMTSVWDRRDPRVCYQVPVGVLDPEQQKLLNMISINLSRGGMFVDTPEELPIGKELVCNVPIGDYKALQVRGRVAWQRPRSIGDERWPRGVGIEFIDLSAEEREQLVQIVGEREELSHPVRLQVEGMQGAINAQAQLTPQGIFFRSPLPFLRLDSQVDFAFDDDDQQARYQGRIVDVKVHREGASAVPRLQVEVELVTIGQDENAIPCGMGSDAVYEVIHVDREDTIPTAVDVALEDAIDEVIDSAMYSVDRGEPAFVPGQGRESVDLHIDIEEPGLEPVSCSDVESDQDDDFDEAEFLGEQPSDEGQERASESDPILLVMPKCHPDISADLADEYLESSPEEVAGKMDRRLWIGAAAMAALVVVAVWVGRTGDGAATHLQDNGVGPLLSQAASAQAREVERVRAIIEGPASAAPVHEQETEVAARPKSAAAVSEVSPRQAPATGGPNAKAAPVPAPAVKAKAAPVPAIAANATTAPVANARADSAPAKASKRQELGGIQMREDQDGLVIRIPIQGSSERASDYLLADPAGFAVNLPYAQPTEGYHDTLSPEGDAVRQIWLRERLGGLHLRIYFEGSAPVCKTEFAASQVTVTCER